MQTARKKESRPMTDYQTLMVEIIRSGKLPSDYAQLNELRTFAHLPIPQCPDLLELWRECGGEGCFLAAQKKMEWRVQS